MYLIVRCGLAVKVEGSIPRFFTARSLCRVHILHGGVDNYICTCTHTYKNTYIHTYIHTCIGLHTCAFSKCVSTSHCFICRTATIKIIIIIITIVIMITIICTVMTFIIRSDFLLHCAPHRYCHECLAAARAE